MIGRGRRVGFGFLLCVLLLSVLTAGFDLKVEAAGIVRATGMSEPTVSIKKGKLILKRRCASCHALKGPSATTLKDFSARKGPDLFYAGIKYNEEWLIKWLSDPVPIRPGRFQVLQKSHCDGR